MPAIDRSGMQNGLPALEAGLEPSTALSAVYVAYSVEPEATLFSATLLTVSAQVSVAPSPARVQRGDGQLVDGTPGAPRTYPVHGSTPLGPPRERINRGSCGRSQTPGKRGFVGVQPYGQSAVPSVAGSISHVGVVATPPQVTPSSVQPAGQPSVPDCERISKTCRRLIDRSGNGLPDVYAHTGASAVPAQAVTSLGGGFSDV